MNRVRLSLNYSNHTPLETILTPFLLLMNEIAQAWNIIFIAGTKDLDPIDLAKEGEPNHVAFDFCTVETARSDKNIASLFGYPHEMRYWHDGLYTPYFTHKENPGKLLDFAGLTAVSYARTPPRIFIMTDSFATRWDGDMDVLAIELMMSLAHIFGSDTARMRSAGASLARMIRTQYEPLCAHTRTLFLNWRRSFFQETMQRMEKLSAASSKVLTEIETEQITLLNEIITQERYIAELPTRIINDVVRREEFRKIMQLEGMARIEIIENAIIGYTHALIQRYPPLIDRKPQTNYDIGGYRIYLGLANSTPNTLTINQVLPGQYRNQYVGFGNVCFGSELNPRINKLIIDCNLVPLFALVLSFLRVAGKPQDVQKSPSGDVPRMDPASVEYARAQEAYVEVINRILLTRAKANPELALNITRYKERTLSEKYSAERLTQTSLHDQYHEYERTWSRLESYVQSEFEKLQKHPWVIGIAIAHGLQLWLYNPEILPYPALLWLHDTLGPQLINSLKLNIEYHRLSNYAPNASAREDLLHNIANGQYHAVLENVCAWLTECHGIASPPTGMPSTTQPQPQEISDYGLLS